MDVQQLKETIENLGTGFEEFKRKNNQRLVEIEKKGHASGDLEEHVERITGELQNLSEIKKQMEALEIKLSHPDLEIPEGGNHPHAEERKAIFLKYLSQGEKAFTPDELKLLSTDDDPSGGYWVVPEMSLKIITQVFETSPMRNLATIESISADALEIAEDLGEAGAGWTTESDTRTETNTPTLGMRRIPVHELYAMPKATQNLLDDAKIDVASWLATKISNKFSRLENEAFITGDGVGKPRGILTYPAGVANPGQVEQVNSGANAAVTSDGLRSLFFRIKSPYINNARWLMRRSTLEAISKLKDNNGQYLWQPGLAHGEPQMLLGKSIEQMEDMPLVVTGSLSIAFGDFQRAYSIVDRRGIRLLRDPFSAKPFVSFYTTKRLGGDVTNFEAFALQKISA